MSLRLLLTRLAAFPHWVAVSMIALASAFLLMARCERERAATEIAIHRERAEQLARDSAQAANAVRKADSVHVVDTLRLTRTVTRLQTLRDSVLVHITDTVLVERFVTASDSVVRACRVALDSCSARVAARDSLLRVVNDQRRNDAALYEARIRSLSPRLLPYVEAHTDPFDTRTFAARAGAEVRLVGPVRLSAALSYRTLADTPLSVLVGARVTF